jgi:protein gp37
MITNFARLNMHSFPPFLLSLAAAGAIGLCAANEKITNLPACETTREPSLQQTGRHNHWNSNEIAHETKKKQKVKNKHESTHYTKNEGSFRSPQSGAEIGTCLRGLRLEQKLLGALEKRGIPGDILRLPQKSLKSTSCRGCEMKGTSISWTDDTANPTAGCPGCELWPASIIQVENDLVRRLRDDAYNNHSELANIIHAQLQEHTVEEVLKKRLEIAQKIAAQLDPLQGDELVDKIASQIESNYRCYAGILTTHRGGKTDGYPRSFAEVTLYPGRMAVAALWGDLTGQCRPQHPWRNGLPRLIFVSDMGDSLSIKVPFEFLKEEVIDVVLSPGGPRHIWLWLTKRPEQMLKFDRWLQEQGIEWPDNLVAMTTITSSKTISRITSLLQVRAKFKGLSVEPLWEEVELPLDGIDWVIVGGESGPHAKPFDLTWAYSLRNQCDAKGVAFFLKQLGANPVENGKPLELKDRHGGDWNEWPHDLRVREFPQGFYRQTNKSYEMESK